MRLPDSVVVGTTVSMALSHCKKANVTEGILLCSSESDFAKIATTILSTRSLAAHPAALGTIVCGFLADVLDYKIETSWAETYVLKTASGQSGLLLAGSNLNAATANVRTPESAYQLMTLRLHNAGDQDMEANELPVLQSRQPSCTRRNNNPPNWNGKSARLGATAGAQQEIGRAGATRPRLGDLQPNSRQAYQTRGTIPRDEDVDDCRKHRQE